MYDYIMCVFWGDYINDYNSQKYLKYHHLKLFINVAEKMTCSLFRFIYVYIG